MSGATSSSGNLPPLGTAVTSTASCPAGKVLLGGGYTVSGGLVTLTVVPTDNRPLSTTTWTATATNDATGIGSFSIQAYAVCSA